jgi:hypothetical protein
LEPANPGCASPRTGSLENNSEKSGIFLAPDLRPFSDHHSPAIHHDFTTKKPQSAATFSQNPLQKHRFTSPKKMNLPCDTSSPKLPQKHKSASN